MSGYESWSPTPASNSTVDGDSGTDIAENNLPRTMNNATRAILSNVRIFMDLLGGAVDSGGTADAQTVTTGNSWSLANQQDEIIGFRAGAGLTNTGAMTLAVDGAAATAVKVPDGAGGFSDPVAGDVSAGAVYFVIYDGTRYVLVNPSVGAGLANVVEDTTPQLGGDLDAQGNNITDLGDVTFKTGAQGGTLRTGTSAADKFVLQAYDTNAGSYQTVVELDAGNPPILEIDADFYQIVDDVDGTIQVQWDLSGGTASTKTTLTFSQSADRVVTFPDETGTLLSDATPDILKADTADTLTAGFATTAHNAGTKSSGTFTPDEADGNHQYAVNGGAHTLAPPTNNCSIVLHYTNNGSAGAITTSGFTLVDGDSFTTTDTHEFICYITKINDVSHLSVAALQ